MFNNQEAIKNIRQKLYNISANLHAESYYDQAKKYKKRISSYIPSPDAKEAQEIYKLSLKSDEWDKETENEIKAFIALKRMYNDNLLMDNNTYWKDVINARNHKIKA